LEESNQSRQVRSRQYLFDNIRLPSEDEWKKLKNKT
jgi:hypothetical protein